MGNQRRKSSAPALLSHLLVAPLLGLVIVSCHVQAAPEPPLVQPTQSDDEAYQPDELLVKFKPGVTEQRIAEIVEGQGTAVLELIKRVLVYRVRITNGRSVEEAVRAYSQLPEVDYAEPNYRRRGDAVGRE